MEIYTGDKYYDVKRIQDILKKKGIAATLNQCEEMGSENSNLMSCGWCGLPADDEDVYQEVSRYIYK